MNVHNVNEQIVFDKVNAIFDFIEKNGNPEKVCVCDQCRTDVICYTLNRIEPCYVVSRHGFAWAELDSLEKQQKEVDIVALAYEGIRQIHESKRHSCECNTENYDYLGLQVVAFHIPVISGRLLNGLNFAPMENIEIGLFQQNNLVPMLDNNWENPYHLIDHTSGVFTFRPKPLPTEGIDVQRKMSFAIKVEKAGFESLYHGFEVSVTSRRNHSKTFFQESIMRLPDLYMFPAEV